MDIDHVVLYCPNEDTMIDEGDAVSVKSLAAEHQLDVFDVSSDHEVTGSANADGNGKHDDTEESTVSPAKKSHIEEGLLTAVEATDATSNNLPKVTQDDTEEQEEVEDASNNALSDSENVSLESRSEIDIHLTEIVRVSILKPYSYDQC